MKPMLRVRAAACLSIVALVLVALALPSSSSARQAPSLSVSPGVYVSGQLLTFEGNIGSPGVKRVHLQFNMVLGQGWNDVEGSGARTNANGGFRFTHPAPSMFGIRMRVASKDGATPQWTFNAKSQDLVLRAVSDVPGLDDNQVVAGLPFSILVDTTPKLRGRPDLPPPAFPGRTLTLQQRVDGNQWLTVDTTTTDQDGQGAFQVTAVEQSEALARALPLPLVYRVRQEDWRAGGNDIGWFPSFPTVVEIVDVPRPERPTRSETRPASDGPDTSSQGEPIPARASTATTAGKTYLWGRSLWDFTWEYGESLTSRPGRGTDPRGSWLDTSDGSGRAAKHNGGLVLDSQRNNGGDGDFGSTVVTMRGNPMTYGRWETKLRLKPAETDARDYHARIELIPDRPRDYHCGAQNITVVDVPVHGTTISMGVKALQGARQWTRTKGIDIVEGRASAFAVEVTRRHISWFMDGRVMGTVRSRAAVSDVPMTLRLSLIGDGQLEMNKTQFHSDWQRGFSLDRGRLVTNGQKLKAGTHSGGC